MGIDYTQEKLWEAMECLISAGSIQKRLEYAGLFVVRLSGGDPAFPRKPELQRRLDKLIAGLTSKAAQGDEGTLAATTRALSDEDAKKLATEILLLFCKATDLATIPVGFESRRRPVKQKRARL